MSGSIAEIQ